MIINLYTSYYNKNDLLIEPILNILKSKYNLTNILDLNDIYTQALPITIDTKCNFIRNLETPQDYSLVINGIDSLYELSSNIGKVLIPLYPPLETYYKSNHFYYLDLNEENTSEYTTKEYYTWLVNAVSKCILRKGTFIQIPATNPYVLRDQKEIIDTVCNSLKAKLDIIPYTDFISSHT